MLYILVSVFNASIDRIEIEPEVANIGDDVTVTCYFFDYNLDTLTWWKKQGQLKVTTGSSFEQLILLLFR